MKKNIKLMINKLLLLILWFTFIINADSKIVYNIYGEFLLYESLFNIRVYYKNYCLRNINNEININHISKKCTEFKIIPNENDIFIENNKVYNLLINNIRSNITLKIESTDKNPNEYSLKFSNIKSKYNNTFFGFHEIF